MKKNKTTLKRTSALLMILLFISIHAVKVHHSHDTVASDPVSSVNPLIKTGTDCAICNYHFGKDGALYFFQLPLTPPVELVKIYFAFSAPLNTSIGDLSANKGPPSFA